MPPAKGNRSVVDTIADIKADATFFLVREFIAPYLDSLKPSNENDMRPYVNREEFFTIIRRKHTDTDEATRRAMTFLATPRDARTPIHGITDLEYAEWSVWEAILNVAKSIQDVGQQDAVKDLFSASKKEDLFAKDGTPVDSVKFTTLRSISVILVDGVVTGSAERNALKEVLDEFYDETNARIITRNEFVVLLQTSQEHRRPIRGLDFERVAFYLFPDDAMDIFILKRLVDMTRQPPAQHSFVTSYCERKMAQLADVVDLIWFLPFLVIYLVVVMSSKGLTPRSYTGYGIYKGFENVINTQTFPECYRNDSNIINCDGDDITMSAVANAEQLYGFLRGHTSQIFWPSDESGSTAAETIVGNSLRPVGAIKIRQYRAPGLIDDTLPDNFFESLIGTDLIPTPPLGQDPAPVLRYPPYDADKVNKDRMLKMASDPILSALVLMPWDGSIFGTCEELNSTSGVDGLNKGYGCDGHAIVVPINATKAGYIQIIDRAIANSWIDVMTRAVFVEYFLFHQNSGMFVTMTHLFEFQAGGSVTTMIDSSPFSFHDGVTQSTPIDILYFVFIGYLCLLIIMMVLKLRTSAFTMDQAKWLLLDLINYILFIISIVVRLVWLSYGSPDDESPVWQVQYFPNYGNVASQYTLFVTIDAFNAILSILAVFRYTKFVPGLDNVVNTLQRSLGNGIVVALFAFVLLFAFAICSCIVYGSMLGYQTVPTAAKSLLVIFWGDYDYTTLHSEQPTFTFFFFAVLNLALISIIMSSIIAVFTDAFSEEKDSAFNAENINAILQNNPHHTLEQSTWRTTLLGFAPLQLVFSMFRRAWKKITCSPVDKYGFDLYDENIAKALHCLLMTDTEVVTSVSGRTMAASEMMALIDMYVKPPAWDPNVKPKDPVTSLYDYAEIIFDSRIDYVLTMTLYVIIPQEKFHQSGVSLLVSAARAQKRWMEKVERRAVAISDEEQLMLRVASLANAEGLAAGKVLPVNNAQELVMTMARLNCRVFLGIISCAKGELFDDATRLSASTFDVIASSIDQYPAEALPPSRLYGVLGIADYEERLVNRSGDRAKMPLLKEFIPYLQAEYAVQCLSCHLSQIETKRFEEACLRETSEHLTSGTYEANVHENAIHESLLSREQFKKVWKTTKGSTPSEALVERMFSIFPHGQMSSSLFLTYCRGNPLAHHCMSFQQEFAKAMDRYSSFLAWFTFYTPFLVIILYFLLIGYNLGESVHVSQSLKATFKPESNLANRAQVNDWLFKTVDSMYLDDDGPATIHNLANYYIGALRIRQHRVDTDSATWCKEVYNVYFGKDYEMNFPSAFSTPELQAFYNSRVSRDYYDLVNGRCYSAFDVGGLRSKKDIPLLPNHTVSATVLPAFQYREVDGYSSGSHDSSYPSGGYILDISFQTNGTSAKQYINELKANNWIATNTRFLVVEFATYNYNLQIYTFSQFGVEITDGGVIWPIGKVLSSPQTPLSSTSFTLFTVLLALFVVMYIILVIFEFVNVVRQSASHFYDNAIVAFGKSVWQNPWVVVDLYIICCFVASWAWRLTLIGRQKLDTIGNNGEYALDLENYCTYCDAVQKVEGTTLFLVFIRYLHILSFNHRISLLFRTITTAAADLLSIFILFVIALLAFALGYILLFGYFVESGFNPQNAFFDLFGTSMGGPPSYFNFQGYRRSVALVFQVFFIVVCMFILYNMVIAVLTGALGKVKDGMFDDAETIEVRDQNKPANIKKINVQRTIRTMKKFLRSMVLFREVSQCFRRLESCQNEAATDPIANQCRSQRTLWANFSRWWSDVDTLAPRDALLSGLKIIRLTHEVRQEKDLMYEEHKAGIMKATSTTQYSLSDLNDYKEQVFEMESLNDCIVSGDDDLLTAPLPSFRSYGRRRLPIWPEYLFSKLRQEYISVKRHMIMVPSFLLLEDEESLWLQALEAHHYYVGEREKYTVDTDGSVLLDMYGMLPDVNEFTGARGGPGNDASIPDSTQSPSGKRLAARSGSVMGGGGGGGGRNSVFEKTPNATSLDQTSGNNNVFASGTFGAKRIQSIFNTKGFAEDDTAPIPAMTIVSSNSPSRRASSVLDLGPRTFDNPLFGHSPTANVTSYEVDVIDSAIQQSMGQPAESLPLDDTALNPHQPEDKSQPEQHLFSSTREFSAASSPTAGGESNDDSTSRPTVSELLEKQKKTTKKKAPVKEATAKSPTTKSGLKSPTAKSPTVRSPTQRIPPNPPPLKLPKEPAINQLSKEADGPAEPEQRPSPRSGIEENSEDLSLQPGGLVDNSLDV